MLIELRTARERRNWTLDQLAAVAGVNRATIWRLENERITNPLSGTVDKLESALRLRRGERLSFGAEAKAS